jgi:ABC-type cobalt transport system substrate-binding protein
VSILHVLIGAVCFRRIFRVYIRLYSDFYNLACILYLIVLIPVCFVNQTTYRVGTDESDVDTEEDIQPAPGRNANPWFSVIDR